MSHNNLQMSSAQLNPNGNFNKISIEAIRKAIRFAQNNIKIGSQGNHTVIFWGYTGTGKSTSVVILNGQQVWAYNKLGHPILTNNLNDDIQSEIKRQQQQGKVVIYIQQNIESGTIYPSCLPMKISNGQQSVTLWDTPGFGDTRSATQILVNTYFIYRLFNLQQKIKMVFTINFNDLAIDKKGGEFKKIIKTLTDALKNFTDYQQSMALLITKANNLVTKQQVIQLLKQNSQLKYPNQTPQARKFFNIVVAGKIPVLLIRRPQTTVYNKKQNPLDVTHNYHEFIQQFYQTATGKLNPAKLPKLVAPGMEPDDIQKCFTFGKQIKQGIMNKTREMINDLKTQINDKMNNVNFTNNFQNNKKQIDQVNNTINFINNFISIVNRKNNNKNQYKQSIQLISQLFAQNKFKYQIDSGLSKPTQLIKNDFIILDFLECINMPNANQLKYEVVFQQFFSFIIGQTQSIQLNLVTKYQQVKTRFQNILKTTIQQQIGKWKTQNIYKYWLQNIRTYPSLFLKLGKFNKQIKFENYLKQLKRLEQLAGMNCYNKLQQIQKTCIYAQTKQNKLLQSGAFLQNIIKPHMNKKCNQLKNQFNIDGWQERTMTNINYNQKIQQSSLQFQKMVNLNSNLQNQKSNFTTKITDLQWQIQNLKTQKMNNQKKTATLQIQKNNLQSRNQYLQNIIKKYGSDQKKCCTIM